MEIPIFMNTWIVEFILRNIDINFNKINVVKLNRLFLIHIGMIFSTLGQTPVVFIFGFFSQKTSYQLYIIVHAYKLISFCISNRC